MRIMNFQSLKEKIKNFVVTYSTEISIVSLGISVVCFAVASITHASAEDQVINGASIHVTLEKGKITATAEPGWHVNTNYPWTVQSSDGAKQTMDVTADRAAISNLVRGDFIVRGGVCNDSSCVSLKRTVTVP